MISWINYKLLPKITLGIEHRISTLSLAPLYSAAEGSPEEIH